MWGLQVRVILVWTGSWTLAMCLYGTPFLNSLAHTEAYVKVQLMLNQRKWKKSKTSSRKGTTTPYFNEAFVFLVPVSQLQVGSPEEGQSGLRCCARPN